MQRKNVGKTYGPLVVEVSLDRARRLAAILGIEHESVTADKLLPAGVVTADRGHELFLQMFNDLTDDGIGNSSRRLAAGIEYHYDGDFRPEQKYTATGQILKIEERQGRTGLYQYGTMETRYSGIDNSAPILRVHTIFAERQAPAVQRERKAEESSSKSAPAATAISPWAPPAFTNSSIMDYVVAVNDINPNHRDDEFARKNGFPSRIASGGMTMFLLGEFITRLCGKSNISSVSFRLSSPVYPLQVLNVQGQANPLDPSKFDAFMTADGARVATATVSLRQPV